MLIELIQTESLLWQLCQTDFVSFLSLEKNAIEILHLREYKVPIPKMQHTYTALNSHIKVKVAFYWASLIFCSTQMETMKSFLDYYANP
jgi:hypothetical protein